MGSSGGGGGPSKKELRLRERELEQQRREQKAREKQYKSMLSSLHVPQVALAAPPEAPTINIPKPEPPPPPATENKQEVVEAEEQAAKDAKRRRGMGSTILAGETGRPTLSSSGGSTGAKTILG